MQDENWGGVRNGAGRKARGENPARIVKSVRLTQDEYRESETLLLAGESWSDLVRRLIAQQVKIEHRKAQMRTKG